MEYSPSNQDKLISFFYVVYKRKWFILAFFIVTYLAIFAGTWLAPRYYKATTKILIHTNPKQEIYIFPDLAKHGEHDPKVNLAQDMVQILTGEEMAREVVSSFRLDKHYYKKNYEPESYRDIVWYYIHKAFDVIKSPYTYSKLLLVHLGLLAPEPEENYSFSALQEFLNDWLDVKAERETRVISLSIWGPEPRLASDIANKMAELLVDRTLVITQDQALTGYEFTSVQLQEVEDNYLNSLENLRRFREENNIISIEDQKKVLISSLDRFETLLTDVEIDLNSMLLEKTEKHIDVLDKMSKRDSLVKTISDIKNELALVPRRELGLERLETILEIQKGLYLTVKDKLEKLLILKANEINQFGLSVITKADLPEVMPVTWPMWDINTIYIGLPLSFFMALFAAFFIDYWTDTFGTKREVEFNLDLPVIGTTPDLQRKSAMYHGRIITDKLRRLKRQNGQHVVDN